MFDIIGYLNSLDVSQLREIRNVAGELISTKLNKSSPPISSSDEICNISISNYVDYSENFISDLDKELLEAELASMSLKPPTTSPNKISNQFVSFGDEPYIWESQHGSVVNDPIHFDNFPNLKRVLNKVNSEFNCDLNCVLVSRYATGNNSLRKHDDDELAMDPTQPICVITLGATRKIEFLKKRQIGYAHTDLALLPLDKSLYVMKPGCQTYFEHRVRKDKRVKTERFCLSFRHFIPSNERSPPMTLPPTVSTVTPSPVQNLNNKFDNSSPEDFVTPMRGDFNPHDSTKLIHSLKEQAQGFSPFSRDDTFATNSPAKSTCGEKLCVIFGTSITHAVNGEMMSRGSRRVINISESGNKIGDIMDSVRDFCLENPSAVNSVDKVIISVGTNDIKHFNSFDHDLNKRFRRPLTKLMKQVKLVFPLAQIIFKCVLPFKITYKYHPKSVHEFNVLLLELCKEHSCIFMDCFGGFLDEHGVDYDTYLYRDFYHLNESGLKQLCRALKYAIYTNVFNPYFRINITGYYYLRE